MFVGGGVIDGVLRDLKLEVPEEGIVWRPCRVSGLPDAADGRLVTRSRPRPLGREAGEVTGDGTGNGLAGVALVICVPWARVSLEADGAAGRGDAQVDAAEPQA